PKLNYIAKQSRSQLDKVIKAQQQIKAYIENYSRDDWETRFGKTNLWSQISNDLCSSMLYKNYIDFFYALTAPKSQRSDLLLNILNDLNSLDLPQLPADIKILKAQILASLSTTDSRYKSQTIDYFNAIISNSQDLLTTAKFSISKIIYLQTAEPNQIAKIFDILKKHEESIDLQTAIRFTLIQIKNDPGNLINSFEQFPGLKQELARIMYSDLVCKNDSNLPLNTAPLTQAQLSADYALQNDFPESRYLLEKLLRFTKFRTRSITYASAVKTADSDPSHALSLLLDAAKLKNEKGFEIEDEIISKQAALLANYLFTTQHPDLPLIKKAFENYFNFHKNNTDPQLEYQYTKILTASNDTEKAATLLKQIATSPNNPFKNKAALDLVNLNLNISGSLSDSDVTNLEQLIAQPHIDNQTLTTSTVIYCRFLLEKKEYENCAQILAQMIDRLNSFEFEKNSNRQNQIYTQSENSTSQLQTHTPNKNSTCREQIYAVATMLIFDVLDRIDTTLESSRQPQTLLKNLEKSAHFSYKFQNIPNNSLNFAEISTFFAKNNDDFVKIGKILREFEKENNQQNIAFLRCKARFYYKKQQFSQAAELWGQIARIHKNNTDPKTQTNNWWRAKYYQISSWSKLENSSPDEILHTIDVIQSSFQVIPNSWNEKFDKLKKEIQNSK
ncbi:MAG: hypothetical protein ISS77_07700, partial [Phycisphaerae bacterium]|nr:hypothetical protein [Phycisphaerae bacterium]